MTVPELPLDGPPDRPGVPPAVSGEGAELNVLRLRSAVVATASATVLLASAGCGVFGGDAPDGAGGSTPVDEGPEQARTLVQAYLDAVVAKDSAAGRGQLCPAMWEAFDRSATGPNGDFAKHFTVPEAAITDIRAKDGASQEVSTSISIATEGGRPTEVPLLFTVSRTDQGWCIADERPGGNAPASPAPTPS